MNSESTYKVSNSSDETSLKDLLLKLGEWWRYLLSKWLTIVLFGILGGILGFAYAWFKTPVYTATTTFVLEDDKASGGGLSSLAGLASIAGVDLSGGGGGIFQGDNILELYKSRSMIEKTLLTAVDFNGKKQLLIDRYIEFNKLRKSWDKKPELSKLHFSPLDSISSNSGRLKDSILKTIIRDINDNYLIVDKPDKKLSIIKAEVKSKDEFFAKAFNDQIVKNVNDYYVQTKTKKSIENIQILQHKTDSVRGVMNGAIYSASAIADATPNLNPTRQTQRAAPMQRSQFSAETNKAILGELVKNLEMSKMALLRERPLIEVIDEAFLPLDTDRISKAKALIVGGVLFGFLTCVYLLLAKLIANILK